MNTFDIARIAGVSRKTVQRVLNNAPNVHPKTKAKVLQVIDDHHYEPNETARILSSQKTQTIGIFIVQDERTYRLYSDDLFYGAVIGGMISQCAIRGYKSLVTILDITNPDAILSLYKQKSIDGGLLISWSNVQSIVDQITTLGYKVGVFDQNNAPNSGLDVNIPHLDNRKESYKATKFLIENGHTDLGIITGDAHVPASLERLNGFLDAVKEYKLSVSDSHIFKGDFTERGGEAAIRHWFTHNDLPKAIFCSNDLTAYGALTTLNSMNISVPLEVSLIGFDDLLISKYMQPPLTTMRIPRVEMATSVTDALINDLEAHEDSHTQLKFESELVIRESVYRSTT